MLSAQTNDAIALVWPTFDPELCITGEGKGFEIRRADVQDGLDDNWSTPT